MFYITQHYHFLFWQTYFNDPASIIMEGILIFNKHLLFVITVIVLFIGWLLFSILYYFTEFNNKFQTKFVHSSSIKNSSKLKKKKIYRRLTFRKNRIFLIWVKLR